MALGQTPAQFYVNKGNVTNVQVNAVNFVNEGRFTISSEIPWDAQNTLNFTNRGSMVGSVGFNFETVGGGFGLRKQASSFYNAPNASIEAQDGSLIISIGGGSTGGFTSGFFSPNASLLNINAAGVTNRGALAVGPNGVMKLFGGDVDLSNSSLMVQDSSSASILLGFGGSFFGANVSETNFIPSTGIYDLGYGVDINTNMPVGGIVLGTNPNTLLSPVFRITNSASANGFALFCQTRLGLTNAQVWIRDEFTTISNEVVQVVAVSSGDTNINLFSSFYDVVLPQGNTQGGYLSPIVEFRVTSTNFATLGLQTNSLYVFDQLGSSTNYVLTTNLVDNTLRPAPIILFRDSPGLGEGGNPANSQQLPPDIFNSPIYSNRFVTNQYAVYSSEIQSVASKLPGLPDVGISNLAGRVEINANNLKLNNTRIRGEGLISINATNLTGGLESVLDSARLSLNVNSTGVLDLKDMTPDSVERFGGFLQVYSGIWTNLYGVITGAGTTNAATNNIEIRFELLAIDASSLHTREDVVAHQLKLRSSGALVYEDNLTVTNVLEMSAPSVTLAEGSRLFLAKGIGFSYTNVLNVSSFTNLGTLQLNELAELRKNETDPFDSFVNRGSIIAFGTEISAKYFENTGDIVSSNNYTISGLSSGLFATTDCFGRPFTSSVAESTEGAITINAETAKIDGGAFSTDGDVQFIGSVFKINNHSAVAGGRLVLDVSDVVTDSGGDSHNLWQVSNGIFMGASHPGGDLLATEIQTTAANLTFIENSWSSEDRGATVDGFTDNAAIGRLVIRGGAGSKFEFLPGAPNSALYVDVLQLDGAQAASIRDFTNRVQIGMNVYYGNIESTNASLTAERLNMILGTNAPYNFIWVSSWAGPNSGVDVPLTPDGPVQRFNRALRESPNIDSDGDGLPNLFDPFPFPPQAFGITGITLNNQANVVSFGFSAQSAGTYVIEYTTNLAAPKWLPLTQLLQNNAGGGVMSFTDQLNAGDPQRYYRVRKAP